MVGGGWMMVVGGGLVFGGGDAAPGFGIGNHFSKHLTDTYAFVMKILISFP